MKRTRQTISLILCLVMLLSYLPAPVFAEGTSGSGLCQHHPVHEDCGYAEPVAGAACSHEHGEVCYVTRCVHVHGDCGYEAASAGVDCDHQHDGECGYAQEVAEVPCSCGQDKHTEECAYAPAVPGTDCTHTHGECSYAEAREEVPCGHDCSEDEACSEKILNCAHEHGEDCGFREAAEGKPCDFVCRDCAAEAADAAAVAEVKALTEALPSLEAVKAMGSEDQQAAYAQILAASEAYEKLTEEQKAQLPGAEETFGAYFAYFSSQTLEAAEDETICGTCGNNLTWEFDIGTGVLKISGMGEMDSWTSSTERPSWEQYATNISKIEIEEGVTEIGSHAFYDYENLSAVSMPEGIKEIGSFAFSGCSLQTITIPSSVTGIGKYAFLSCAPFFIVSEENNAFASDSDGVLYNKDKTKLIVFPKNYQGNFVVPDSVESFSDNAFYYCKQLTGICIPDTIKFLGFHTFFGCSGLKNVVIPVSVSDIGPTVFANCTGLENVTLSSGVANVYEMAFFKCTSLKKILIPSSVTEISKLAFADCSQLSCIQFEGDAPKFGDNVLRQVKATAYYPVNNSTWTSKVMKNYGGNITWKPYGNPATKLIFSDIASDRMLRQIWSISVRTVPSDATVDMEYSVSDESILKIEECTDSSVSVIAQKPGTVTLTATDKLSGISVSKEITITEYPEISSVPFEDDIPITSDYTYRYYTFTPAITGRYIFSSTACERQDHVQIGILPVDQRYSLAKGKVYPEKDKCQVYADLEAGENYLIRLLYLETTVGRTAKFQAEYLGDVAKVTGININAPDFIECELWPMNHEIYGNSLASLKADLFPVGSSGTIFWETSDSNVIEVNGGSNNYGGFTPISCGTATITATCNGYSDSVTITVKEPKTLRLNQWEEVTHDKGNTTHTFKFTPRKTGEYVITMDSGNAYYPQDIISVTTDGSVVSIPEDGYGVDTQKWYLQLNAGETYSIQVGSLLFNYGDIPAYKLKIVESAGTPESMRLRLLEQEAGNKTQVSFGTYFFPVNAHEEIVKVEVSDESVLQVNPYWNLNSFHRITATVIGEGRTVITATTESGLTASYTYYAYAEDSCGGDHDYDVNQECVHCGAVRGTCGDDLTWTLERGVLTIFGTGAMTDYAQGTAPWYSRRVVISEIVLNEGLTSIGSYAFDGITAIAHYPGNDPAWTEAVRQNYGGSITWIPLRSIGEDLPLYDPQEDTQQDTQQKEDVMEKEEIGCQSGHSYRDPAFVWGENDTCTAVFVCRNCDDTRKVVCDMTMENEPPTENADGRTTYTARAVFGGREYTDSRSYIVPAGERVVQKVMPLYGEVIIARGECSHSFTKYTSDGNATCELDGSKTALCDQGCGESHTLPDTGSRLEHQMEGGSCALCGAPDEKASSDGRKVLLAAALGVSCVAALAVLLMRRKKK